MTEQDKFTRRKVLAALGIVGAAGAGGGAATTAYLSDEEGIPLTFTTGSISLKTNPSTLDFPEGDGKKKTTTVNIANTGSIAANKVQLADVVLTDETTLASSLKVLALSYNGTDFINYLLKEIDGKGTDSTLYLSNLEKYLSNNNIRLAELTGNDGLQPDESAKFKITLKFDYEKINKKNAEIGAELRIYGSQRPQSEDTITIGNNTTPDGNNTSVNSSEQ